MEFISALKNPQQDQPNLSRRRLLATTLPAAVALPAALSMAATGSASAADSCNSTKNLRAGKRMESRLFFYDDPREHQRQSYRILRSSVDDADVLFWYLFTMFSVPQGRAPQSVVRWEGIEFSHHRKLADGVFRVHGHNLSFPRDLKSGAWTDAAINPVTGKTVEVPPMVLTQDPGYVYTPEGVIPLDSPTASPRIRLEQFMIEDDLVKIEQVRQPPASWPATFVETSVNWCSRDLFENTNLASLPTGTSGGYIFPWPEWMDMGDAPGHMFATWHGRKLGSVNELPEDFLARAEPGHKALLSISMSVFEEPLPEALAIRITGDSN